MSARHTGRCACGAVSYVVTGPLRPVSICHCESCRRQTTHWLAATEAPASAIEISGARNLRDWRATDKATRRFCSVCGSVLFWIRDGSDSVSIGAGSLDAPTGLAVDRHIFVAEKGDYYEIPAGLPTYPGTSRTA